MHWRTVDIHGPASAAAHTAHADGGSWEHAGADAINIVNATSHPFRLQNASANMYALALGDCDDVTTHVAKGASGTIGAPESMPWAMRLSTALDVCDTSARPCVCILDAPSTSEMQGARKAMHTQAQRINAMMGSNKMVVLTGKPCQEYPVVVEGIVSYSQEQWHALRSDAEWGLIVNLQADHTCPHRMVDAFALVLGTYIVVNGRAVSTAQYPGGAAIPKEALTYISFSPNVIPGTPVVSTTRGITAETCDGKPWHATVVVQTDDGDEEDRTMSLLRLMLTSAETGIIGSCYFQLRAIDTGSMPAFVQRALAEVHAKTSRFPPGPTLCRNASMAPHHSSWQ
jgi:hypothetical protein